MTKLKEFLETGLLMMPEETQKERVHSIYQGITEQGITIDGAALARLIDEVKAAAGTMLEGREFLVPNPGEIRSMLDALDGRKEVANMTPGEIVVLVDYLRVAIGEAA